MTLADHLSDIQRRLRAGEYPNEAAVSGGIVRRVLDALGWPVYDPRVVYPEYSVKGRRVDFALCNPADKPRVFVEVKQPGQARGADQQLFEYAFHEGVPMAVMTDGREWHVYVPAGAGSYDERRVYLLDLYERTAADAAESLRRYLDYDRVRTEAAMQAARDDYDRIARSREGERHLPAAWARLLANPDASLVALLAEKVEGLCGVRPDEARVEAFLRTCQDGAAVPVRSAPVRPAPARPSPPVVRDPAPPARPGAGDGARPDAPRNAQASPPDPPGRGYVLGGVFRPARTAADVYRQVIAALMAADAGFAERFAQTGGRTRMYMARDRAALFPGRPEFQNNSSELPGGWYLGLNVSRGSIEKRIRLACDVAGIRFGKDLTISL